MPAVLSFSIVQDARLPSLEIQAFDANGALNLSSASSPKFYMSRPATAAEINGTAATITSGPEGKLRYDWASGDTDTVGTWYAQFEVTIGGLTLRIPSHGHIEVNIVEKT